MEGENTASGSFTRLYFSFMPSCYFPQLPEDLQTHRTFLPHCLSHIHCFCLPAAAGIPVGGLYYLQGRRGRVLGLSFNEIRGSNY